MSQERTGDTPSDSSILIEVMKEWLAGAGGDLAVRTIDTYLDTLRLRFGGELTIEGASIALERLSQNALTIRQELMDKKTTSTSTPDSNL